MLTVTLNHQVGQNLNALSLSEMVVAHTHPKSQTSTQITIAMFDYILSGILTLFLAMCSGYLLRFCRPVQCSDNISISFGAVLPGTLQEVNY